MSPKATTRRSTARFPATIVDAIRKNGSLKIRAGRAPHRFLGIWAVIVDDRVFVRTWNDKPAGWYRAWRRDPEGAILVSTRELPVRARHVRGARLLERISAAYLEKYWRPASLAYSRGMDTPERRATTLELVPARASTKLPASRVAAASGETRKARRSTR